MTHEEIIEMARQAGGVDITSTISGGITTWIGTGTPQFLEVFAKLVAAKAVDDYLAGEREAELKARGEA